MAPPPHFRSFVRGRRLTQQRLNTGYYNGLDETIIHWRHPIAESR